MQATCHQKEPIFALRVEPGGTGRIIGEARGASSGMAICRLYARRAKASPCMLTIHAGAMQQSCCVQTQKRCTYPRGRGLARVAGHSCLAGPSVPHWPRPPQLLRTSSSASAGVRMSRPAGSNTRWAVRCIGSGHSSTPRTTSSSWRTSRPSSSKRPHTETTSLWSP
jgi:hypothetical protein